MFAGSHVRKEARVRNWLVAFVLGLMAAVASADPVQVSHSVDLRDAAALQQLRQSNPAHFAAIERILAALTREPARAEGDWLQANFPVHDVELTRMLLKTSNPPRQLLRFTLDDTRYTLHVIRTDLVAEAQTVR
jgi:hypothetical protein